MKKIKTIDLRLEKEVISALTETDLGQVVGGAKTFETCLNCPEPSHPVSYNPNDCRTLRTCLVSACNVCLSQVDSNCCVKPISLAGENTCEPVIAITRENTCAVVVG